MEFKTMSSLSSTFPISQNKLIRRVRCRLKLLRNKRTSILKHLRNSIAQLLIHGYVQHAFNRVEELYRDESIVVVYDLLDHFSESIIKRLQYIRRHKDCPDDINEAISSLIYASAWFGEIPELLTLRKLFSKRYGQNFVLDNLKLYPGNHVNCQIKEKLSMISISDEVKQNLIEEIAKDCRLQFQPLAIKWRRMSEMLQNQVPKSSDEEALDRDIHIDCASTKQSQAQGSSADNFNVSMPNSKELLSESFSISMHSDRPCSHSINSSKEDHIVRLDSTKRLTILRRRKESEEMVTSSSSEFSYQFMEEKIVYLDDVMEIQSPITKDGISQDQRIFIFQSSILPKKEKLCSVSTRKIGKTSTERVGKRATPLYCQNAMGIECLGFYNSKFHRKWQKKIDLVRSQRPIQCSLEHPCYDCTSNGDDDDEDDQMGMRKKTFIQQKQKTRRHQNDAQQPEECGIVDYPRSSSSQSQLHSHSSSKSSTSSHVHPKLPDYDELQAKFMALKKAYMQNQNRTWNIK